MHYTVSVRRVATGSCVWPRCVVYRQYIASKLIAHAIEVSALRLRWGHWAKLATVHDFLVYLNRWRRMQVFACMLQSCLGIRVRASMYDCMVHRTPGPSPALMGAMVPIPCTTLSLCVELQLGLVRGPVVWCIASTLPVN